MRSTGDHRVSGYPCRMSSRTTSIGGVISLLGAFLASALVLGLLAAGLVMPAVGATGALARSGVDEHLKEPAHRDAEEEHAAEHHHDHEPMIMIAPLVILALGALFAGLLNLPDPLHIVPDRVEHALGNFLGASPSFAQSYQMESGISLARFTSHCRASIRPWRSAPIRSQAAE